MAREQGALLELAESVADGTAIDWEAAERQASEAERIVIRQLRVLATLGHLHRTLPQLPDSPLAARSISAPAIGRWGHLSLLERLGGGTFGEVYRAWDAQLEREVALKLLRREDDPLGPNGPRIVQEARRLARIRHQNVVTVYGVDAHDDHVGLWMELIPGATLEEALSQHGPFSAREAALIGIDLCRALAAIHAAGLLHRDVKAQNVMREEGGRIVLMDLGTGRDIAAGGPPGDLAGTPLYLAPEIFDGEPAGVATDLYSLGVLLYRLVTAEFPIRATTMEALRDGHVRRSMIPLRDARPDLPTAFVRVIDRALSANPADRYDSAGSFEADLVRTLETPASVPAAGTTTTPRSFAWSAIALAAAVVVLVGFAAFRWRSPEPGAGAGAIRSIAVLPLRNDSGDPAQEYFADGMTDEIISTLGRLGGFGVISRTSSAQFKGLQFDGRSKSLPEIAAALNADAIMEGSVAVLDAGAASPGAKKVRIRARLIAAGTDTQIWSQTFERLADDVLALEADVAKAIADGIRVRLSTQQQAGLNATRQQSEPDFEAFNLYLRGRYYWNLRTKEGLERSIQLFHQAIEKDPGYAAPHAGLADAYKLLFTYSTIPHAEALARGSQEAMKALALDPSLAEAHASLALVDDARLDWKAADASIRRALELNPNDVNALHWHALFLSKRGLFEEATAELQKALALDPLSVVLPTQLGGIRLLARDYDGAIAQLEGVLEAHPDFARAHFTLAQAYAKKKLYDRALFEADRAAELGGDGAELRGIVGWILASAGRRAEAEAVAEELIDRYRRTGEGGPVLVAGIYASMGDSDRAFEWLERARDDRDPLLAYLKVDPPFDAIRTDPRFATLLAGLGLTQ